MNKTHDLSIKSTTVEIKVLKVDGHKMTKAVFRQIQRKDLFDKDDIKSIITPSFKYGQVLGFIWDDGWHILWVENGEPREQFISAWDKKSPEVAFLARIKERFDQLFIAT